MQQLTRKEKQEMLDEVLRSKSFVSNGSSLLGTFLLRRESTNPTQTFPAFKELENEQKFNDGLSMIKQATENVEAREPETNDSVFDFIMSVVNVCSAETTTTTARNDKESASGSFRELREPKSDLCRALDQREASNAASRCPDIVETEVNPSMELILDPVEEKSPTSTRERAGTGRGGVRERKTTSSEIVKRKKRSCYSFGVLDI